MKLSTPEALYLISSMNLCGLGKIHHPDMCTMKRITQGLGAVLKSCGRCLFQETVELHSHSIHGHGASSLRVCLLMPLYVAATPVGHLQVCYCACPPRNELRNACPDYGMLCISGFRNLHGLTEKCHSVVLPFYTECKRNLRDSRGDLAFRACYS